MKKLFLTILSCLMLVSCCLLGGCSSQEVYKLSKIKTYNSETKTNVTIEIGDDFLGTKLTEDTIMLIVDGDSAFLRFYMLEENDSEYLEVETFQWKQGYDNEYYACVEGEVEAFIAKKDGKQISFDYDGDIYIFEK